MDENELKNLWKKGEKEAASYFDEVRDELVGKANRRSNDILQKVKRNMIWESALNVVVSGGLIWLFRDATLFELLVIFIGIAIGFSFKFNLNYLKRIARVYDENILTAMIERKDILADYVKRIRMFTIILTPIAFMVGFWVSLLHSSPDLEDFLVPTLISLPFMALMVWLGIRYVQWLYGKHLKHLKSILEELETEENE